MPTSYSDPYHAFEDWVGLTWENGICHLTAKRYLEMYSGYAMSRGDVPDDWTPPSLEFNMRDDRVSWYDVDKHLISLSKHPIYSGGEPDKNFVSPNQLLHEFIHAIIGKTDDAPHGRRFIGLHFRWLVITVEFPDRTSLVRAYKEWRDTLGGELNIDEKHLF